MINPEKKENNDAGQKRNICKNEILKETIEDKSQSLRGIIDQV